MMIRPTPAFIFGVVVWLLSHQAKAEPTDATAVAARHLIPGLPGMRLPVQSMRERRYRNIVRQQQDFTCGAAALATVLREMFGREISEQEIIDDMLAHTDADAVRARGFSLLDMKNYLERTGLRGRGYRIDANALRTVRIPVIALHSVRGLAHFVVLKRIEHEIVYIADPILGHRQVPLNEFVADWNGIIFAVLGDGRKEANNLVDLATPLATPQRAGLVTRSILPQQEFSLFGRDTF